MKGVSVLSNATLQPDWSVTLPALAVFSQVHAELTCNAHNRTKVLLEQVPFLHLFSHA